MTSKDFFKEVKLEWCASEQQDKPLLNDMMKFAKLYHKEQLILYGVSCSAIVENEQVELFFKFDDDEPISAMKCNGKKFTMEMIPVKNNFVTFTDGEKTMKLFVKH